MERNYVFTVASKQGDVAVPRSTIWDTRLSPGAFRLLCLVLEVTGRRPDWKPYTRGFAKMLKLSERSVRYYEAELRKAGYLTVEKLKDERGRFAGYRKTYMCARGAEMAARMKGVPE